MYDSISNYKLTMATQHRAEQIKAAEDYRLAKEARRTPSPTGAPKSWVAAIATVAHLRRPAPSVQVAGGAR